MRLDTVSHEPVRHRQFYQIFDSTLASARIVLVKRTLSNSTELFFGSNGADADDDHIRASQSNGGRR